MTQANPLLATDLRQNSTEALLTGALVLLTNFENIVTDSWQTHTQEQFDRTFPELTDLREILEELRHRDGKLRRLT